MTSRSWRVPHMRRGVRRSRRSPSMPILARWSSDLPSGPGSHGLGVLRQRGGVEATGHSRSRHAPCKLVQSHWHLVKGTHVAVTLPNISAFPVTWLALARLGAVMVPVNVRYTPAELGYVLTDSEAEFLVIDRSLITTFNALEKRRVALTADRIVVHGAWNRQSQLGTACRRGNVGICSSLVGGPRRPAEHPIHVRHHRVSEGLHAAARLADDGPASRSHHAR